MSCIPPLLLLLCAAGGVLASLWDVPRNSASTCNPTGGRWDPLRNECVCYKNFRGARCELIENCLHGKAFGAECLCSYGWTGIFCHQIDCQYGYIAPDSNATECICDPGFAGMYCDACLLRYHRPPHCLGTPAPARLPVLPEGKECSGTTFNYYLNIILLTVIAIYISIERFQRRRRREQRERETAMLASTSAELETLMRDKYARRPSLPPCPRYEEAVCGDELRTATPPRETLGDAPPPFSASPTEETATTSTRILLSLHV